MLKRKPKGIHLDYTYEDLEKILKDATVKAQTGRLSSEDKLYGAAAGHALDLIDASRAAMKPLDLTFQTENNLFMALLQVCFSAQKQKKAVEEIKIGLSKKLGSYELFCIVNSLNVEGKIAEITVQANPLMAEPRLVVTLLRGTDGKPHTFDPLTAARETVDGFDVFDSDGGDGPVLGGTMNPFFRRVEEDLLKYVRRA